MIAYRFNFYPRNAMSYDLYLYNPQVKNMLKSGHSIDQIKVPQIPAEVIHSFRNRLEQYDYKLVKADSDRWEYQHVDQNLGVSVSIYNTEICFSVPFWDDFDDALFEARMTSAELSDTPELVVYDPQGQEWLDE
jgi:hypothetical protein